MALLTKHTAVRATRGALTLGTVPSQRRIRSAFTIIELLVAVGIMVVLLSAILVAAASLSTRAKVSATQAVLTVVQQALDEFHREQESKPTLCKSPAFKARFGSYPPDELEWFGDVGFPGKIAGNGPLTTGGAKIIPAPGAYAPMKFYTVGLPPAEAAMEHRDLAAMILAIEIYGDASARILDGIQDRYRVSAVVDANGDPAVFLDRKPAGASARPDGVWTPGVDHEIRLIVDDWGVPLSYLAQRDWREDTESETKSTNHPTWNEASTEMVRLNGNKPVIFSYGPDGKDQLTQDAMGPNGAVSLVGDFEDPDPSPHATIDNTYNADNVYADSGLKAKLAKEKVE